MSFTWNCCPCQWPDNCVSELAKVLRDICKCCWGDSQSEAEKQNSTANTVVRDQRPSNAVGGGATSNSVPVPVHIPDNNGVFLFVAGELQIEHSGDPEKWTWKALPEEPRFKKVAELQRVWWLQIKVKLKLADLSPKTNYAAYLVFNIASITEGLNELQEATVATSSSNEKKKVCINPTETTSHVGLPVNRPDGWMEVELGQFYCDDDTGDQLVVISLEDINTNYRKRGLIVAGIELRPLSTPSN